MKITKKFKKTAQGDYMGQLDLDKQEAETLFQYALTKLDIKAKDIWYQSKNNKYPVKDSILAAAVVKILEHQVGYLEAKEDSDLPPCKED